MADIHRRPSSNTKTYRVLIVDDEPRVLGALKRCFAQLSPRVEITTMVDGESAMKVCNAERFDLVISDLRMPKASGVMVLRAVRREMPGTIRVILSGQATSENLMEVLPFSHLYLEKPCSPTMLTRLVHFMALVHGSNLPQALIDQAMTITALPCEGILFSLLKDRVLYGANEAEIDRLINSDLGISVAFLRVLTNILPEKLLPGEDVPTASQMPPEVFSQFLQSRLIVPLFEDEELLAATRLVTVKWKLLENQLKSGKVPCYKMLAVIAYIGELSLVNCVGAEPKVLELLRPTRDDITRIIGHLWGFPDHLLDLLYDADLLALRNEIDSFFPVAELQTLSSHDLLRIYREVLCWID